MDSNKPEPPKTQVEICTVHDTLHKDTGEDKHPLKTQNYLKDQGTWSLNSFLFS